MKLNFFFALFDAGCPRDLRETHRPVVRAIAHAAAAANDGQPQSGALRCRWRRNPASGKPEAWWTTHD